MPTHVVIGAGPVGSAVARLLAASGERVRVITRGGSGPDLPGVERVAADATDADRLSGLTAGAATVFHCAMPPYDRWPELFPPLSEAVLAAAASAGARYLLLGNVYGYGPVDGPLTEDLPLAAVTRKGRVRAAMWREALAAHEAGRVLAAEVRGSDYLGRGAGSLFNLTVAPAVLAGEPAAYPADLDAPHAWTYTGDAAATLVAVARAGEGAFGRAWHVPSASDLPARELTARLAGVSGAPAPRLRAMPEEELERLGATDSVIAELPEMAYLYRRPLEVDAGAAERELGVGATPLERVLEETAAGHREAAAR
ncbi:NAD-dependent epimerase/dehydratase family protein [Streptomyces sp. DSM 44917]|uniref:NAD-dependent epimerase/dehydratase family protein n=1 Tax=Streptomyces boetiae TaxID=3075541 RepID=A0ABU2L4G8_9ACTN|nr:NAD-dependent epimerase/dehydratase family protein [Streptomyces sp. DSM 44917]MDT0306453.1 NAD-dependent epimerase/dehydratase family protein [Streptomyces sp. DSM 44917]